jgi:hypothetical protein
VARGISAFVGVEGGMTLAGGVFDGGRGGASDDERSGGLMSSGGVCWEVVREMGDGERGP